jgi:hypothetical protein
MPIVVMIPVALLLIAGYVVYDRRYHGRSSTGLQPTKELFRDPATGKLMRVHENPQTGAREYVDEDE